MYIICTVVKNHAVVVESILCQQANILMTYANFLHKQWTATQIKAASDDRSSITLNRAKPYIREG